MKDETITVYLDPLQAKQYVMMQFLASVGFFDLKDGLASVDFDKEGKIRNVRITRNYKETRV